MNYSRRLASRGLVRKKADFAALILRVTPFIALVMICVAGVRLSSKRSRISGMEGNAPLSTTANSASLDEFQRAPKIEARGHRLVYPYSIVPGGISSADELRQAAAHDSVVASHYVGFNYRRARLVEVKQAQKVYLSYRLRNKVYWTVRQASLHPGEKLLTDGTLTARTRCGNQVSVLPHMAISPDEPTLAELDRPDAMASGIQGLPASPDSRLLAIDPALPFGPSHTGPTGIVGGGPPGVFVPPPIGGGGGGPGGGGGNGGGGGGGHPPETPEPGTIVLVLSGAGIIFARYRKH
ncbi:MAG TPA: PEP-CTERM sorting domain-containing protein [Terriglobales bacterium]|nr:PEP-CTERM sorting domain-containing protein [Terriglobales bacterium]